MPASEIDDIFSSKGKAKAPQPVASSSTAPPKKKKKDKKRKREVDPPPSDDPKPSKPKRAIPETIVDPSAQLAVSAPPAKRPKKGKSTEAGPKKEKESEARFKDSRGTGPSIPAPLLPSSGVTTFLQDVRRRKDFRSTRRTNSGSRMKAEILHYVRLTVNVVFNHVSCYQYIFSIPPIRLPFFSGSFEATLPASAMARSGQCVAHIELQSSFAILSSAHLTWARYNYKPRSGIHHSSLSFVLTKLPSAIRFALEVNVKCVRLVSVVSPALSKPLELSSVARRGQKVANIACL